MFELNHLEIPLKSLSFSSNYIGNPSLGGMLILDFAVRFMALSAVSSIICVISIYVKYQYCLVLDMIIVLPQFLYMLGIEWLDKMSLGKYIAFFMYFG